MCLPVLHFDWLIKELPYFPPHGAIPEFNLQREAETNILLIKNKWGEMFMVRKESISLKYSFVFHLGIMKNTYLKCLWKVAPGVQCALPDSWGCRCREAFHVLISCVDGSWQSLPLLSFLTSYRELVEGQEFLPDSFLQCSHLIASHPK